MSVRERIALGTALVAALAFLAVALLGDQGSRELRRLRQERAALSEEIADLRDRRAALERDIARLREDPRAIERRARRDLGMIREGETVFLLPERHAPQR
ncbi:MAG: septum formation initiator family protein [Deferrisomatales bacterium]|nr:septum formation initiator family protein [Deferrisomatales bacterium]